jgi:hypothetical protein
MRSKPGRRAECRSWMQTDQTIAGSSTMGDVGLVPEREKIAHVSWDERVADSARKAQRDVANVDGSSVPLAKLQGTRVTLHNRCGVRMRPNSLPSAILRFGEPVYDPPVPARRRDAGGPARLSGGERVIVRWFAHTRSQRTDYVGSIAHL